MKITPFLWLESGAKEAAAFYCSIFPRSRVNFVSPMTVSFSLDGNDFVLLNGGPDHKPTPAVSFVVPCKTQKEIDHYWKRLLAKGGRPSWCGWLEDRYGFSWQIIPENIGELIRHPKGMDAMLKMRKLDIKKLQAAAKK
jgi:predicted 3-demethylubiquinone-9 3-methyltransferase (glyoxalase superfamily)